MVVHDQSRARVPPKHRIVVPGRTNRFSTLEARHRFAQPFVGARAGVRHAAAEPRPGATLPDDAGEIVVAVLVVDPLEARPGLAERLGALLAFELIGQRQNQRGNRLLVAGVRGEHVEADAGGLARLVEQTVTDGLFERARYRVSRQLLQFELHLEPPSPKPSTTVLGAPK